MGARGPVPNRSEDQSRDRDANRGDRQPIKNGELLAVEIPEPDPDWHEIATMLWNGIASSGQAGWYQNSDWALAWSLCEDLSHYKRSGKRSGQMLQTIYSTFERLLIAEGDRRRVRAELVAPDTSEEEAVVLTLADYTDDLGM